jgi:hypothetical protein
MSRNLLQCRTRPDAQQTLCDCARVQCNRECPCGAPATQCYFAPFIECVLCTTAMCAGCVAANTGDPVCARCLATVTCGFCDASAATCEPCHMSESGHRRCRPTCRRCYGVVFRATADGERPPPLCPAHMAAEVTMVVASVGQTVPPPVVPLAVYEAVRWYRAQRDGLRCALACARRRGVELPAELWQIVFREFVMCEFTHLVSLLAAIARRKLVA